MSGYQKVDVIPLLTLARLSYDKKSVGVSYYLTFPVLITFAGVPTAVE